MLVYGDPQFSCDLQVASGYLTELIPTVQSASIDQLRHLLVKLGQLEQALEDAGEGIDARTAARARECTDIAASAFLDACGVSQSWRWSLGEALERLRTLLREFCTQSSPKLRIKVPEGFQFYALFPEQYVIAADQWLAERRRAVPGQVVIIGVRSIGTTISALVQEVLRNSCLEVFRLTVRPTGHPFDREAFLPTSALGRSRCAVIVDEGPGLSGSSIAAVARELSRHGIEDVSIFPGHAGEPGAAAPVWAREQWRRHPRYIAALHSVRWFGVSLEEGLVKAGMQSSGGTLFNVLEDASGGLWRSRAYERVDDWPAVCAPLERMKFLQVNETGPGLLWKFTGFAATCTEELGSDQLRSPAPGLGEFISPAVLTQSGFSATAWLRGPRALKRDFLSGGVFESLARYIALGACPPLDAQSAKDAFRRLKEMLCVNSLELLGESAAAQAQVLAEQAEKCTAPAVTFGDGHMAPHEWVWTSDRRVVKTDATDHRCDHTLVGEQPVWWDVGGSLVEWNVGEGTDTFLDEIKGYGLSAPPALIRFYAAAYGALQAGRMSHAMSQTTCPAEQGRVKGALESYSNAVESFLRS